MNKIIYTTFDLHELLDSVRTIVRDELSNKEKHGEGPNDGTLYNVKQTALFLGIAEQTVYALTSKSEIPHFKKGKKLYFKKHELIAWVESGQRRTQKAIQNEAVLTLKKREK